MIERRSFERELEALGLRGDSAQHEQESPSPSWVDAVFRALHGGERRINVLLKIGRDAGGTDAKALHRTVLSLLRVPYPAVVQSGGVPCEKNVRRLAKAQPDQPKIIYTGRYEAKNGAGRRYFWAINQAGNTVIAIRTPRGVNKVAGKVQLPVYIELRGDIQADGTAVLFRADKPEAFWGYLRQQPDRTFRWHDGSYFGPNGTRQVVDGSTNRDEILALSTDNRPTMMASLWKTDDRYSSVLLQQREWFPLTHAQYQFLESATASDTLRDLLEAYLKLPAGVTYQEKQAKQTAAGRLANYVQHLVWEGNDASKPALLSAVRGRDPEEYRLSLALEKYAREARRLLPTGHHNNPVLALFVAKMLLADPKLNHAGNKRSFLDWLTKVAQDRNDAKFAQLLDVPLVARAGRHEYRIKLDLVSAGFWLGGVLGYLTVEKLSEPKWTQRSLVYDVEGVLVGSPKIPERETVFDLVVPTEQEWMPDDFEGTLFVGEIAGSVGYKSVKPGATAKGAYLRSKNGLVLALEGVDFSLKGRGDSGKKGSKPKFTLKAEAMWCRVRRQSNLTLDLSKPRASSQKVTGALVATPHFCFGSSLLTPAARQYLRVVCADQLAALGNESSTVSIIGHTDRPDTIEHNQELSTLRAENVKLALHDILGSALRVPDSSIRALGLGEWMAVLKLRPERVRSPTDRRVDLLVNGVLVASFRE